MYIGGEELSLLSAKVARSFRNASILTVIPAEEDHLMKSHRFGFVNVKIRVSGTDSVFSVSF